LPVCDVLAASPTVGDPDASDGATSLTTGSAAVPSDIFKSESEMTRAGDICAFSLDAVTGICCVGCCAITSTGEVVPGAGTGAWVTKGVEVSGISAGVNSWLGMASEGLT